MKVKKNLLWLFDPEERERRWRQYGEEIRILQVYQHPDTFGFGKWDIEEVAAIGKMVIYIVTGVDPRDGTRSKVVKYSVTNGAESDNGEQRER